MPSDGDPIKLSRTTNFVAIQYLRGVSTIAVVYFHTKVYMPLFFWPVDRSFGYAGVDVFFAISGLIMVVTTFARDQTIMQFLFKRVLRIYPIYWIATLTGLAAFLIVPSAFTKSGIDTAFVVSSLLLVPIPSEAGASDGVPFLKIAWTLVFEVFFYAIFATSLLLANLTARIVTIAAIMMALVGYGIVAVPQSAAMRFYTNPLILEFVFGCIAGYLVLSDRIRISRSILAVLSIVSLIAIGAGSGHGDGVARLAWFGLPAAVVVFCCAFYERHHGTVRPIPILRLFGDASYSIYLFQSFLLIGIRIAMEKLHFPIHEFAGGISGIVCAVIVAVLGGTLIHLWIERPCLLAARRIERFAIRRPHSPLEALGKFRA